MESDGPDGHCCPQRVGALALHEIREGWYDSRWPNAPRSEKRAREGAHGLATLERRRIRRHSAIEGLWHVDWTFLAPNLDLVLTFAWYNDKWGESQSTAEIRLCRAATPVTGLSGLPCDVQISDCGSAGSPKRVIGLKGMTAKGGVQSDQWCQLRCSRHVI
jgi:hypothetical protein